MPEWSEWIFVVLAAPFCIWATFSDLKYMKIPNRLVLAMALLFLIIAPFVLPLEIYIWRIIWAFIVLVFGFLVFSIGGIGGGDAKFAAAMTLFIIHEEILNFLLIFSITALAAVFLHRMVGKLPVFSGVKETWVSFSAGRKFPLGTALGGGLLIYLIHSTWIVNATA